MVHRSPDVAALPQCLRPIPLRLYDRMPLTRLTRSTTDFDSQTSPDRLAATQRPRWPSHSSEADITTPRDTLPTSLFVTDTETDADDENLRFLRTPLDLPEDVTTSSGAAAPSPQPEASESSHRRRTRTIVRQLEEIEQSVRRPNYVASAEAQLRRDPQQRDRMTRVLSRLSRFSTEIARPSEERARQEEDAGTSQTEANTQAASATTVQSLASEVADLRGIIEELRRDNSLLDNEGVTADRTRRSNIMSSVQRAEREVQALERRLDATQRRMDPLERYNESLRSTAILQHARTNASTTERMLRYIRDREQLGGNNNGNSNGNDHEGQSHDSNLLSRWSRLSRNTGFGVEAGMQDTSAPRSDDRPASTWRSRASVQEDWDRRFQGLDAQPRTASTHHRGGKVSQPAVSGFLENTIVYLDRLRSCVTYDEAFLGAIEMGFVDREDFAIIYDNFPLDASKFATPFRSSWLQNGVKFAGSQHTTFQPVSSRHTTHAATSSDSSQTMRVVLPEQQDSTRGILPILPYQPRMSIPSRPITVPRAGSASPLEHWPVKVTLHSVDFDTMTLSGTMEAYDVPNHSSSSTTPALPHGSKTVPITTFLEGHIIDLKTHSFQTPPSSNSAIRFPATTAAIDAANWRRLPPFVDMPSDTDVARLLLSHSEMSRLNEKYVFMRWKERCFIHSPGEVCQRRRGGGEGDDQDTGHGLTISGFYYVSLERGGGGVVGLYYDPATSPYQCLRLEGVGGGVEGAWEFR